MARALLVNDAITIPAADLQVSFARSAGPGGQNVNKVNTKAQLRWAALESAALPPAVKARLLARYGNRINNEGELVLSSDEHREQARNLNACREKLRAMIISVLKPPRRRVKTKPTRASVERRIVSKQRQADKKRSRRGGIESGE
jgi:ribosome-associated protein